MAVTGGGEADEAGGERSARLEEQPQCRIRTPSGRGPRARRRCRASRSRAGAPSRSACSCCAASRFLYFVLPKLAGVGTTVHRIEQRRQLVDRARRGVRGAVLRRLHRAVPRRVRPRADGGSAGSESYEITMAGLAATRLFAAAGAGGVALTAWALRRSGMEPRLVACRMVAFIVLLYAVYAGSLFIDGIGLGTGLFPGGGSFAITFVPAIVAALLFGVTARGRRCCRTTSSGASASARPRLRAASPAGWPRAVTVPALAAERRAHRDRTGAHARSRAARRARLVGLRHRACCGRCSTRSARRRRSR